MKNIDSKIMRIHPDYYDMIYKKATPTQRDKADWYLAKLAVQAHKDGETQLAHKFMADFIEELL